MKFNTMAGATSVLALLLGLAGQAWAQTATPQRDQTQTQTQSQTRTQERIYGSQLMTQQERNEYRQQMRTMKTAQEREAFRLEHHKRMQDRARERGVTLPDEPPKRPGTAPGGGMGPGGGGGGRGR